MRPFPGVEVILINESAVVVYSAMVPAHIAGEFPREAITFDLVRLCRRVGVRFVVGRVTAIDSTARRVWVSDRAPLTYDVLSLGLGSLPGRPPGPTDPDHTYALRPMTVLLRDLDRLEQELNTHPRPFHLIVVGGGASGCELTVAIAGRFARQPGFRMTLLQGNDRLLPQFATGAAEAFIRTFQRRGVGWQLNAVVVGCEPGSLVLESGERLSCDGVLWATDAAPPSVIQESGLTVDTRGFLRVRKTLQSESDPTVFGTGDCVTFDDYPGLPRNGVYAVRQGAVLFDNIGSLMHGRPLKPFRPQRYCLALLNTGDGRAVFAYGPIAWEGRWARRLKNWIDRAWIDKFQGIAAMTNADESAMRCGGCGSKVAGDVLTDVLRHIEIPSDPRVLIGCREGEDAAVFRRPTDANGRDVEVQTVDYFRSFTDDPYLLGRVAAVHALSDLYAMNAQPFAALALATLPHAGSRVQEALLLEMMSGAERSLREARVVLAGGHTTEGAELGLGFAVTGHGEEARLFRKNRLRPGDCLILTKPIGSGALLAAWMRGECRAEWMETLIESMLRSNGPAAAIFARARVEACTDVTGFGLAGHLLEMLEASRVSARLFLDRVPVYPGFQEVVSRGIVSTLHSGNATVARRIDGKSTAPEWLFDPQTSGGLLAGVRPEAAAEIVRQLEETGCRGAVIGEVIECAGPLLHLTT